MPKLRRSMAPKTTTTPSMPAIFQVSLLSCRKTGRVLFLETGKDFVDLLLSFLLLPVGTIIHILSTGHPNAKHLGGISSVYESVRNMERSFLKVDKQTLVEPRPAAVGTCVSIGLLQRTDTSSPSDAIDLPKVYYRCSSNSYTNLSSKSGSRCETCSSNHYGSYNNYTYSTGMTVLPKDLEELEAKIVRVKAPVASSSNGQGFVKESNQSITYIVTDCLEIMPSTTIRSIKVLNKLKVATLSDLESSDITVSIAQVLQLLQAALTSSTCLNDVFGKK